MRTLRPLLARVLSVRFEKVKTWRATEHRLSARTFFWLWLLVALLHALFAAHLFFLAYCHRYITSDLFSYERRTLGLPPDLTASMVACILVGLLFCEGLVSMVRYRQLEKRIERLTLERDSGKRRADDGALSMSLCFRRLGELWTTYVAHFGSQGELFAWRYEVQRTLSLASQSLEVVAMSKQSTSSGLILAYAMCIGLSGMLTPLLFLAKLPRVVERTAAALVPALLTMILVCLLPWIGVSPYIRYFMLSIQDKNDVLSDDVWFYNAILMGRKLFLISGAETITRLLPCLCVWWSLRDVEYTLCMAYDSRLRYVAPPSRPPMPPRKRNRFHGVALLRYTIAVSRIVSLTWGTTVVALSIIYSSWNGLRTPCTPGCLAAVNPWFTVECRCVVQVVNCAARGISQAAVPAALSALHPSTLQLLIIAHCPDLEVPNLARFPQLFGFEIYNSTIVEWPNPIMADVFTSLSYIVLVYTNVSAVPRAIAHKYLPPTLTDVEIIVSGITEIDEVTVAAWTNLNSLLIEQGQLRTVPASFHKLTLLGGLSLFGNNISELPARTLGALNGLTTLNLAQNPHLRNIPDDVNQAHLGWMLDLFLENTSVAAWSPTAFGRSTNVYMSGTPYCTVVATDPACRPSTYDGSYRFGGMARQFN
ncbi:hypothetical protein SDRG_14033 [Saprolegnia diclina VS20]|uniref:Leucine-rich repeat-containing N-terminal plant-type domain-containing protein n=1 Tax=Saprolegnia diclina (strain VS20) TaxID=1156394 RepID=T0PRT7_SAPDV|nr:hypothetical protein SDRG_14033 [Saprolegnia diclina VS20]EQC28209.1 hypothetical protein SDRG_14033 [Saprolegnia diclina VS20]|eukprot:XP_008618358.1 hypothetical protein SDRG_14033 [Saprolegnia diclina VS20]